MINTDTYEQRVRKAMMPYLTHIDPEIARIARFMESYAVRYGNAVRVRNDAHAAHLLNKYEMWAKQLGCDPLA